ncbi:putative quinol monooxygenase [Granulicella sibirica]|uniref:putative quinol monooxygenase n=1 Tax=Granulicella sibirica TaxID=2479048 RepID=UPI001863FA10|nr:putative quinol monooxygenase [Granulicella sibirica]
MPSTSTAFVVIAELQVPIEHREEFLKICQFDSEHSVADEPGCRQFDVLIQPESPETIVLYEVYDDRAAFDTHLTMPHFAPFAEGLERLNIPKPNVRFFTRNNP